MCLLPFIKVYPFGFRHCDRWGIWVITNTSENQPLDLWQIIHDAKEAARKMSKKLLMECLQLKSGISDMFYKTGKYVIDLISINDYYLLY